MGNLHISLKDPLPTGIEIAHARRQCRHRRVQVEAQLEDPLRFMCELGGKSNYIYLPHVDKFPNAKRKTLQMHGSMRNLYST